MYFINRGNVQVVLTQINGTTGAVTHAKLSQMGVGAYFGEIALLDRTHPVRTVSVVSITYCNFFILKLNDFEEVMRNFPEVAAALQKLVEVRRQKSEATNVALENNKHMGRVLTSGIGDELPKPKRKNTISGSIKFEISNRKSKVSEIPSLITSPIVHSKTMRRSTVAAFLH